MLAGSGVFVGTGAGVLVGSGVLVGIGVKVGVGLTAHPLIACMIMLRSASHKHALSSVFCIFMSSQPDFRSFVARFWKAGSRHARGCRITDAENGSATSEGSQPVAHHEPDKARQDKVPLAKGH